MKTHLLILGCSKTKAGEPGDVKRALELYDGQFYRVLKRALYYELPHIGLKLDVLILSAKYGLIGPNNEVAWYDQKMTMRRARQLQGRTKQELKIWLRAHGYQSVFCCMGLEYRIALGVSMTEVPGATYSEGGIGLMSQQLRAWLEGIK